MKSSLNCITLFASRLIINYSCVSNRRREAIEGGVHIHQFLIKGGTNRRGCSCQLVFNKKRVLMEWGMHVGSFSIEKEC